MGVYSQWRERERLYAERIKNNVDVPVEYVDPAATAEPEKLDLDSVTKAPEREKPKPMAQPPAPVTEKPATANVAPKAAPQTKGKTPAKGKAPAKAGAKKK